MKHIQSFSELFRRRRQKVGQQQVSRLDFMDGCDMAELMLILFSAPSYWWWYGFCKGMQYKKENCFNILHSQIPLCVLYFVSKAPSIRICSSCNMMMMTGRVVVAAAGAVVEIEVVNPVSYITFFMLDPVSFFSLLPHPYHTLTCLLPDFYTLKKLFFVRLFFTEFLSVCKFCCWWCCCLTCENRSKVPAPVLSRCGEQTVVV